MKTSDEWEKQPVCKICHYRRPISTKIKIKIPGAYWDWTICYYFLDTNELRDGRPQGDYCPNFKPRE
jgi:hypothetical protein